MTEETNANSKVTISKQDFLNFSQKTTNVKSDKSETNKNTKDQTDFVIEMTSLQNNITNDVSDNDLKKSNIKELHLDSNESIDDDNEITSDDENKSILQKIEDIQSNKKDDNNNVNDGNDIEEEENEKSTYLIPKHKMISYLVQKNQNIQDKQTIYEYFYESLNLVYSRLSIFLIIISSLLTLVGSLQVGDVNMTTETKMTFKVLVILFSFIITVLSSVKKFMLFKEKIESIGKYMEQLEILIDNINIVIQRINFLQISDQEFFKQLETISIVVTRTNSKLFNIRSDKYYQYYKKLKLISSKKWEIKHQIKTDTESKYNDFLKNRLSTMKERLKLKKEFKILNEQIDKNDISSFYSSNIFTQSYSTENKEE